MKKVRFLILLLALFALMPVRLAAYDFTYKEMNYTVISDIDNTVEIASAIRMYDSENIEIPSIVSRNNENYTVVRIGHRAFANSKITSVKLPETILSIEREAFANCGSLENVIIMGESLSEIKESAFSNNESLKTINLPKSVTFLGPSVFSGCTSLGSVTIPGSVESIENRAFSGCTSLKSVTISGSVESIENRAFSGCTSLESIIIPRSVTSLYSSSFDGCSSLNKLVFEDGEYTLNINEWGVTNPCPIDSSYIGRNVSGKIFSDKLKTVVISNSVTSIGNSVFSGCSGLTNIEIPNSVTSIGEKAFSGCSGLTNIEIPNSVTSIGNNAFERTGKSRTRARG